MSSVLIQCTNDSGGLVVVIEVKKVVVVRDSGGCVSVSDGSGSSSVVSSGGYGSGSVGSDSGGLVVVIAVKKVVVTANHQEVVALTRSLRVRACVRTNPVCPGGLGWGHTVRVTARPSFVRTPDDPEVHCES
ncbi:hypothetical protein J6590_011713 [Homalodisca vitripennis]|nr:hypothetical protein J6590_011713 [Homalodisca vitripennis]